jgi:protein-disulfide isomerase
MAALRIPVGSGDHTQGADAAAVTLVEYGDYECPHCGAAHPVVQQLQAQFGNDLRFVFRNFPIAEIHPHAVSAAMTAEFGAAKGMFWQVHDALFENQQRLGAALYDTIVTKLGLAKADLHASLEGAVYEPKVSNDFNGGVRSGVNGTPSFFINGQRYDGSPAFDSLADVLSAVIEVGR